ncbi:MAG: hypothetical protein M3N82_00910 [Pseudomonadota bacterium]|nr:hypothetical protein [Pseudomonadota bacterium]
MRKLADSGWWTKSLEVAAIRQYEAEQTAAGNVRNYVSDGLFAYTQLRNAKKRALVTARPSSLLPATPDPP